MTPPDVPLAAKAPKNGSGPGDDDNGREETLQRLAYVISHDLPEPLRQIRGYLQLLQRRFPDALNDDGASYLQEAIDGAGRMQDMLDALLRYSRVTSHGSDWTTFDANDAIGAAASRCPGVDLELTGTFPTIRADARQVEALVAALLDNARRSTMTASGHLEHVANADYRTTIRVGFDHKTRILRVRDNGIGFTPIEQDRAMRLFHSGWNRAGLGLPMAQRIAQRHGGDISIRNGRNGATVYWHLGQSTFEV